jgi:hypothetical protein
MSIRTPPVNRRILVALFFAVAGVGRLVASVEFAGFLQLGERELFMLADGADGTKSDWLKLGDRFRATRIVEFDAENQVLLVEEDGVILPLTLKPPAPGRAAPFTATAAVTSYGVLHGGVVDPTPVGVDSLGEPVRGLGGHPWIGVTTTEIPLKRGLMFGFHADFEGLPKAVPVELEYRFHTPRIVRPDGTSFTLNAFKALATTDLSGRLEQHGAYYRFDHDYELVPGTYRMEVLYQSRVLAAKDFTVVPRGSSAGL